MQTNQEELKAKHERNVLRAARTQMVMALRGKPISIVKKTLDSLELKVDYSLAQRLSKNKRLTATQWYNLTTQ